MVTPGFVDPHTHYDAQLFWDPAASSSSLHGVTTIMAGNCGFTLAPVQDRDADYLRRMMAKVEGMPLAALEQGVPWSWSTFGEYLDLLDGNIGVNAGFLVGHCAIRRNVMGADSVGNEASEEQVAAMTRSLHEAIDAGGLGFSTTLSFTHSDGDGEPVASRWASRDEVLALCAAVRDHEGTTLEYVTDGCLRGFRPDEVELMAEMTLAARRPLNWNVLTVDSKEPERYREQLAANENAAARGGSLGRAHDAGARRDEHELPQLLRAVHAPRLAGGHEPAGPGADGEAARPRDPRATCRPARPRPTPACSRGSTDWGRYMLGDTFSAENEGLKGRKIADLARERGRDEFDTLLDVVLADDLRTVLWPLPTDSDEASWELRKDAWARDDVLLGGSDAGAHLDRMCGAPYTTRFLADCLRGRKLVPLERAVQLITQAPAELFGLRDRGVLTPGAHADLVLFDPETIDMLDVTLVDDLPGGTSRLNADATGVTSVFVNGRAIARDGHTTGDLPGGILRSGRDTRTVEVPAGP